MSVPQILARFYLLITLHAKLSGAVFVIGPVCLQRAGVVYGCVCVCVCVCVCLWDWYHDNSELRASIFTKLGLQIKVATISS